MKKEGMKQSFIIHCKNEIKLAQEIWNSTKKERGIQNQGKWFHGGEQETALHEKDAAGQGSPCDAVDKWITSRENLLGGDGRYPGLRGGTSPTLTAP